MLLSAARGATIRLMRLVRAMVGLAALAASSAIVAAAADPIYRLSLGDPARRDRDVRLVLDGIVDTATGETIDPGTLAQRLAPAKLVIVGEEHTSVESHRVQLHVIRALEHAGRHVLIALEMFPYAEQPSLDAWAAGRWTEEEFLAKGRWYDVWGYRWSYYRDIFLHGRASRMPFLAVNVPREVVSTVRQKGLAAIPPDAAGHLPPSIDVASADHLTFFRAALEDGGVHGEMPDEALKSMLAAQATWDAAMAWNATKALERAHDPAAVVVLLAGSGHVGYGLGIERQARSWFTDPIASLMPVAVADEHGPIGAVRASYANFVWGVPREASPSWPALGISTRAGEDGRRQVIDVDTASPAHGKIENGDAILSIGSAAIDSREAMNRALAALEWGDVATLVVKRNGSDVTVAVPLRRAP
jgi:uncharacterized iron-regulated protein